MEEKKMKVRNIFKHFWLITRHKYYVFKYCMKAGLIWQGITHDLSKYSPTEFWESVKHYDGTKSPIDVCKQKYGYSMAWFHHRGRNRHHYEYWQDNFDQGGNPVKMPFRFALEMVCDYLGAGQAYSRKNFTYESEYAWWENKKAKPLAMHPDTKGFVDTMLKLLTEYPEDRILPKKYARRIYDLCTGHVQEDLIRKQIETDWEDSKKEWRLNQT